MDFEDVAGDTVLFARLRASWEAIDPVPADLADRMVAAVAVEDLSREYALLTLVETDLAAVRGATETLTLQFSDGTTTVLLHVTQADARAHRIDGWVDADALAVKLVQDAGERAAELGEHGRFAFDGVPAGVWRLKLAVRDDDGDLHDFQTPQFEV